MREVVFANLDARGKMHRVRKVTSANKRIS
jgi:hypothetical protein